MRGSKSEPSPLSISALKPKPHGRRTIPTMTEDADPFDTADSSAAILAFIHAEYGADGLKELLSLIDSDRESLERDAAELNGVGLAKPAQIVSEAAKQSEAAIEKW